MDPMRLVSSHVPVLDRESGDCLEFQWIHSVVRSWV